MMRRVVSNGIRFFSQGNANRVAASNVELKALAENLVKKPTPTKEALTIEDMIRVDVIRVKDSKEPMREMTKAEREYLCAQLDAANSPGGGYY